MQVTTKPSLDTQVITLTNNLIDLACERFKIEKSYYDFKVKVSNGLGTTAGICHSTQFGTTFTLEFNRQIIEREGIEEFENTITHEIAHAIQKIIYPRAKQAHGPEFKKIHIVLGGNGKTHHSYDVKGLRKRAIQRHVYICGCTSHKVATPTHNKIQKTNGAGFLCKLCRGELTYKESITLV